MGQKKRSKRSTTVDVSSSTVRHLVRPRAGFDAHTAALIELYRSHTQELFIAGLDPSAVLAELAQYAASLAAQRALRAQLVQQQETTLLHASSVWTAMLAVYEEARSASKRSSTIRAAIADFEQFMRNQRVKKPATTAGVTPVAA